jgi:DNA-binding Lrp family transcriptional regulator
MYDNKNEQNLVKTTQQEVSEELGLSRVTVNKIFKQLKENNYIIQDTTKVGRYYLTAEGITVVETFRKINKTNNERGNKNE